jgi:hypothetical protein
MFPRDCAVIILKNFVQINPLKLNRGFSLLSSFVFRSDWLMKAEVKEVPLPECREKYVATGLSKIPDNLRQTQMCATGMSAGNTIDACQGESLNPRSFK